MHLSITADGDGAKDLSFLLHKHPAKFQSFPVSFGKAHAFYPHVDAHRVTACLMLEVDPVAMAKKQHGGTRHLAGYVNDRPFVTSSFMSTAIASVFGSAMSGRCKDRPEAVTMPMRLTTSIASLPVRGGESFLRSLFEPLGYAVSVTGGLLDEQFLQWGESPYLHVTLKHELTLTRLLSHLYVLIPVFDNQKHYFVGEEEIEKLLVKGEGWLASHPCAEAISRRYLRHQPGLVRQAVQRLEEASDAPDQDAVEQPVVSNDLKTSDETMDDEKTVSLNTARHQAVAEELVRSGATRVIDLGCGEGKLLRLLLKQKQFSTIVGMDVSVAALEIAAKRLRLDAMPDAMTKRISLLHGSLMYRDRRLSGFGAAALVEVIEHLDPPRLSAMERVVFEHARPQTVVVTTPNAEYNVMWESLGDGNFRHSDHRFEWSRAEFRAWCETVVERFGYVARHAGIGPQDDNVGTPTQMAVFVATTKPHPA